MLLKKIGDVVPTHQVKGLANIKLEKKCGNLSFVKSRRKVLHLRKVVMYASLLNKNT
jgi:hypothetical protein